MKQLIYILVILSITISNIHGQQPPQVPKVIPSSPEASSLGKYGAFPVGYYTGVPSINIPLYEIKAGEIKLPISLSYHASGIRVDDIAPWVGLGWSLNAGGCISVETKGKSDIVPARYYNGSLVNNPYPRIKSLSFNDFLNTSDINTKISLFNLDQLAIGESTDSEPDIYNYNFGGFSGQFFMTENFTPQFLKNNDGIKVSFNPIDTVFKIIDKNGKQYFFKHKEITESKNYQYGLSSNSFIPDGPSVSTSKSYTSWNLSQIVGENQLDTITFIYESSIEKYTTRIQGSIKSYEVKTNSNGNTVGDFKYIEYIDHWELSPTSPDFSNSYIEHKVFHLKQILHNRTPTKLKIDLSTRDDLLGGKKINAITILYENDTINYWKFNYSYFTSIWTKQEIIYNVGSSINPLHKRLKLNSIQKFGNINEYENPYYFDYYFNETNSKLPHRNCYNGFDHWGYFNSELNTYEDCENALKTFPSTNSSDFSVVSQIGIAPTLIFGSTFPDYNLSNLGLTSYLNYPPLTTLGGVRTPNINYTIAYTLKSIQFPSGGKSNFEYENHQYSSIGNNYHTGTSGGLRIKRMVDKTSNDSIVKEYIYDGGVVYSKPNYLYQIYNPNTRTVNYGACKLNNYSDVSPYSYGSMIGYKKVTEKIIDKSKNIEINSVNEYYSSNDYAPGYYEKAGIIFSNPYKQTTNLYQNMNAYENIIRPFDALILGKSFKHGLQKKVTQYSNNIVLKVEDYSYDFISGDSVFANKVKPYEHTMFETTSQGPYYSWYYFDIYFHETGKSFMKRKTEKVYDMYGANPIIKSTIYEYDINTELLKSSTDSIGSKMIRSEIKYPTNYTDFPYYQGNPHPLQQMQMRNMINYPIEQKTFVNNKLTNTIITTYLSDNPSSSSGKILPNATYGLNTNVPMTDFATFSAGDGNTAYNFDSSMNQKVTYTYYPDGNIKEIKSNKTGITTTYLWSYKGQYPVAEIINGTYSTVEYALNGYSPITMSNLLTPDMSKVNSLRTSIYLGSAQVNTFTYNPLVGVLTKTDSRGITSYFDYDNMNRLKETFIIENGVKKVLQKYDYHYQNQ